MPVPDPWALALLAAATYRLFRLVAWDDLTAPLRARAGLYADEDYDLIAEANDQGWDDALMQETFGAAWSARRFYWARFARCPYCVGWWIGLAVLVGWWAEPHATLVASVPLALNAVVALAAANLDPKEQ